MLGIDVGLGSKRCLATRKVVAFVHKSHLSDPLRLARLLIAAALAYLWIVYLGTNAYVEDWIGVIHRSDRCDLSLFQLGLRLLEYFLNEAIPIPAAFLMIDIEFD